MAKEQESTEVSAEKVLSVLSIIILVCGILATLICAFAITTIETCYDTEFNPAGFGITVSILVGSLITWSIMKVLANISITLKEIYKKLK